MVLLVMAHLPTGHAQISEHWRAIYVAEISAGFESHRHEQPVVADQLEFSVPDRSWLPAHVSVCVYMTSPMTGTGNNTDTIPASEFRSTERRSSPAARIVEFLRLPGGNEFAHLDSRRLGFVTNRRMGRAVRHAGNLDFWLPQQPRTGYLYRLDQLDCKCAVSKESAVKF